MRGFLLALSALAFLGCGDDGNEFVLQEFQGGAFITVEMPGDGIDLNVVQLSIEAFTLDGTLIFNKTFDQNDLNSIPGGPWPKTVGSCIPIRQNIEDAPANFLPGDSSCVTFAMVRDFEENDPTDDELLVTLNISAQDGTGDPQAEIAHTVRFQRGLFLGDPDAATELQDIFPFVATLNTSN